VVEGRLAGPCFLQKLDVLVGARISRRLVEEIAVLGLLVVRSAGDDVHSQAAVDELIQCRELPRRQRRGDEAGTVRE